jgi:hypothetical protein
VIASQTSTQLENRTQYTLPGGVATFATTQQTECDSNEHQGNHMDLLTVKESYRKDQFQIKFKIVGNAATVKCELPNTDAGPYLLREHLQQADFEAIRMYSTIH